MATLGSSVVFVGSNSEFAPGPPQGTVFADTYDDAAGEWSSTELTGIGPVGLVGGAAGSRLLVSGALLRCGSAGYQGCAGIPTRNVAVLDVSTQQWSSAQLSEARWGVSAIAVGTQVLFAGGSPTEQASSSSNVVDIYDAQTDRWSVARLPHADSRAVATVDKQAVFFGHIATDQAVLDVYDTATGRWLSRPVPRPHTAPVVAVNGPRVLVIADVLASSPSDNVDIYDTATDSWSSTRLTVPRIAPGAATIGGRTLVAGGLLDRSVDAPASDLVDVLEDATGWLAVANQNSLVH